MTHVHLNWVLLYVIILYSFVWFSNAMAETKSSSVFLGTRDDNTVKYKKPSPL